MSQVTIEGSKILRSTFLAPGARITVERTKYISNLIARGYVNLIADHEPIRESAVVNETGKAEPILTSEEMTRVAEKLAEPEPFGVPPESASKSVWLAFLDSQGVWHPVEPTKAMLIQAWTDHLESGNGGPTDQ